MLQEVVRVSTLVPVPIYTVTMVNGQPVLSGQQMLQPNAKLVVFAYAVKGAAPNQFVLQGTFMFCEDATPDSFDGACIISMQPVPVSMLPWLPKPTTVQSGSA